MRPGDIVFHYADKFLRAVSVVDREWRPATRPSGYRMRQGDGNDGWLVEVVVHATGLRLHFHDIQKILPWGPPGPLDKNGVPRQVYVARLREEDAARLAATVGTTLPDTFESSLFGLPASRWDEDETDSSVLTKVRWSKLNCESTFLAVEQKRSVQYADASCQADC